MSHAITFNSREWALELHAFLKDIDSQRWRDDLEAKCRERLNGLQSQLEALLKSWPEKDFDPLKQQLVALLKELQKKPEGTAQNLRSEWANYRKRLQPAYESVASSLKKLDIHIPSLRPTNYRRSIFHAFSGLSVMLAVELLLSREVMLFLPLVVAIWAWSAELSRRFSPKVNQLLMKAFSPIAHPHEHHRVNSATWYVTALLILGIVGSKPLAAMGVIVLGFADPAAAFVGRPFGKTKLINGRSLEGTLTFLLVGWVAAYTTLAIFHPEFATLTALAMSFLASAFGAAAELFARKLDDNFLIPLSSAAGGAAALALLG